MNQQRESISQLVDDVLSQSFVDWSLLEAIHNHENNEFESGSSFERKSSLDSINEPSEHGELVEGAIWKLSNGPSRRMRFMESITEPNPCSITCKVELENNGIQRISDDTRRRTRTVKEEKGLSPIQKPSSLNRDDDRDDDKNDNGDTNNIDDDEMYKIPSSTKPSAASMRKGQKTSANINIKKTVHFQLESAEPHLNISSVDNVFDLHAVRTIYRKKDTSASIQSDNIKLAYYNSVNPVSPTHTTSFSNMDSEGRTCRVVLQRQNAMRFYNEEYEGEYNSEGLRHGKGKIKWSNGDTFDGTFRDGMRNGLGTLIYHDGSSYKGGWKNDVFHGYGVQKLADEYIYYGNFVHGTCNGHGQCVFSNGDRYFGGWKDGLIHGYGKYHHANGDLYEGMFVQGVRDGPGRKYSPNGKLDILQYVKGEVTGLGLHWSRSRLKATKLIDGVKVGKKMSLAEAARMEKRIYDKTMFHSIYMGI
mmetsp:Transcript_36811/g.49286  ORF Transcript_36811/g.49286 Transcript_36811/m.49286 type:complete len:475 (+) Transcript_36811:145-1569(+)